MAQAAPSPGAISMEITRRDDRSAYMFLLQHMVKLFRTTIIKPRKVYPSGSPRLDPPSKTRKLCDVRERQVEGLYMYDLVAKQPSSNSSNGLADGEKTTTIYYFAGGAWQMPASSEHWALCAEIATQIPGAAISLVSYPLAPNNPAPHAFPRLMEWYRHVLRDAHEAGKGVVLAGDSAGGNVVLCMTLAGLAESETAPCPKAVMVISPATDMREQGLEIEAIAKHDPILTPPFINANADIWRGEWDATDPRVTPLMANLSLLSRRNVKIHGIIGRYDSLSPSALLFREKCIEEGVQGEWLDWAKQMHCFPLAFSFKLPESVVAKDWLIDVLRRS